MQNSPETNEKIEKKGWGPAHLPIPNAMMVLILFTMLFAVLLTAVTGVRVSRQRERVSVLPNESQRGGDPVASNSLFSGPYAAYPTRSASYAELGTDLSSSYMAILNTATGEILAGKNADARFAPASMTKIMTMLVLCEHLRESDLDRRVTLTKEIYDTVHPTKQSDGYYGADSYFRDVYIGSEITLRTAFYGIGVSSFADCTLMAVLEVAESEEAFVAEMNAEAEAMGLKDTHFDNVIGYESEENYTTATEMAAILARALQCDLIREVLSTPSYNEFEIYDGDQLWHGNFYSTLFNTNEQKASRFKDAGIAVGGKLDLKTAIFGGGKTGTLKIDGVWTYSLANFATAKTGGTDYVVIAGETSTKGGVINDSKTVYDQYVP